MSKLLDVLAGTGASVSIAAILSKAQTILAVIAASLSITSAVISIILKLKRARADGIITAEEKDEIGADIKELTEVIKDVHGDNKTD